MVIKALKPAKRGVGQWLVAFEDGSTVRVGEQAVLDFGLYVGKELSSQEAGALDEAIRDRQWRSRAWRMLADTQVTRKTLLERLEKMDCPQEKREAIADEMERLGYLDDQRYAAEVVRHYSAKGYGARKIRDELFRRGVPREYWDQALEQAEDPAEAIDAFLAKKLKGGPPDPKELKKASDALARRGYSWSDISEGLRRYGAEVED